MSVGGVSDLVVDQDVLAGPPLRSNKHFAIAVTMSVLGGTRSPAVGFLTGGAAAALSTMTAMVPNSPCMDLAMAAAIILGSVMVALVSQSGDLECFFTLHPDKQSAFWGAVVQVCGQHGRGMPCDLVCMWYVR